MNISKRCLRVCLFGLIAICSVSCSDPNPEVSISENDIKVLMDAMLLEAVLQDFSGEQKDSLAGVNYDVLFERHGVSEKGLDELRNRLSQNPTQWSIVADSIESRLKWGRANFDSLLNLGLN